MGKVFKTLNTTYFYDTGTSKIFACEDKEELILKTLTSDNGIKKSLNLINKDMEQSFFNIMNLVEEENILKTPYYTSISNDSDKEIEINNNLEQIVLELTENCNMKCKYCIYNNSYEDFRNFSNNSMNWDIARASLDYAKKHSSSDLVIGFYGGEPLLNFNLLKKCIDYCNETMSEKNILYSFTSNLTLVTPEIAEYLSKVNNLRITCSLDGPENVQDEYRVYSNGDGSFSKAIHGLELLIKKFGQEKASKVISIHSVICPPYSKEKYVSIRNFFEGLSWLPKGVEFGYSYVAQGSLQGHEKIINHNLKGLDKLKNIDPIKYWAVEDVLKNFDINSYAFMIIRNSLFKIHELGICEEPLNKLHRNACCLPGIRKLYITIDGIFKVCERIGESPIIGNLYDGLDINKIKKSYIEEYDRTILKKCNNCWAMHICPICYAYCFSEKGVDENRKELICQDYRGVVEDDLILYFYVYENNPYVMEVMDQILEKNI